MKEAVYAISIMGISYLGGLLFPWYFYIPIVLVISAISKLPKWTKFFISFFAIVILWLAVMYSKMNGDQGVLAGQISQIFGGKSSVLLSAVTYIIAGFFAGIAALLGEEIQKVWR